VGPASRPEGPQRGLASLRFPSRNTGDDDVTPFDEALRSASLIVVSGAGGLNDVCREWALATLAIVEEALDRRVPAAMLSQGIGPLRDPSILEKLRSVVPRLEMLTLREGLCGPRILEAFGVPEDTAMVTGDDAVTLAFDERPSVLGQALGLNLRLSPSSGLDEGILDQLAPVMRELPAGVPLLPVPIARDHDHSDSRSLEALGRRCGIPLAGSRDLDTPLKVIRQAGRCRLVVTGAYHAAVFALAQGIPAVCIAGSEYFRTKFDGLARSFPSGCEVLSVPDPEIGPKLLDAIRRAWQQAPQGRQRLLELARTQAQQSHRAYASLGRTLTFQESGR
jgi:hypothetical protein